MGAESASDPIRTGEPARARIALRVRVGFAARAIERALESAGIGWLAAAMVASAALLTSPSAPTLQLCAASAIAAAAAGLAWWIEHGPARRDYVRDLDMQQGLQGALSTAVDAAREIPSSPLADALARRVERKLTIAACVRAALPSTPAVLGAPLLGVAILLVALDRRALPSSASSDRGAAVAVLDSAAQSARSAARSAPAPGSAALEAVARELERGARTLASVRSDTGAERAEIERLSAAIARESRDGAGGEIAPDALAAAHAAVESARRSLGLSSAASTLDHGSSGGADGASAGLEDPLGADSAARAEDRPVAPAARDGRMAAPQNATQPPGPPAETLIDPTRDLEGGVSPRWWNPAYDGVVARWVEARRTAKKP
jgi:hypothetical protein